MLSVRRCRDWPRWCGQSGSSAPLTAAIACNGTCRTGGVEIHFPIGGHPQLVGPLTGPEIEVIPPHTTIVGVRFHPGTAPPLPTVLDDLQAISPGVRLDLLPDGRPASGGNPYLDTTRLTHDTGFAPAFDVATAVAEYVAWRAGNPR